MKNMKRSIALVVAIALLLGCAIGGTLAWLMDETDTVTNTFSTSTIGVELKETTTEYKMVPGWEINKNPKTWIAEGSEAAYLFINVVESTNFDDFMTYAIADGWTLLGSDSAKQGSYITTDNTTPDSYVIYREVTTKDLGEDKAFDILNGNKIVVKGEVTKEMMTANDFEQPTLSFKAYAHQLWKTNEPATGATADAIAEAKFKPAEAWENVKPQS